MFRKGLLFCIVFILLTGISAASGETVRKTVFYASEREMFAPEADTLDLYVAPLLGADCMCLICGGEAMLVDTGKESNYREVKAMLDGLGITGFRYIFNSHPHEDHLGAFMQLVKDFTVGEYLTVFPRDYRRPFSFQKLAVDAADHAEIPVTVLQNGDSFTLGGAQLTVYRYDKIDDMNLLSGYLLVSFGSRRLLLTGDCDGLSGRILSENNDLHAEIMKYPHHGISYVFDAEIENISPEFVIFPHGYFNTANAQKQLNKYHIPFGFATWGVIHASTDGRIWVVDQTLSEDGAAMMEKYGDEPGIWD